MPFGELYVSRAVLSYVCVSDPAFEPSPNNDATMTKSTQIGEWPFGNLASFKYRVILADPPWKFSNYSPKGEVKNPIAHYPCMTIDEIKRLPVSHLAHAGGCALICWATAPLLPEAFDTMKAWGFRFKSAGAWAKQSSTGGKWAFGTGYCYRSAAEFWLLGTLGNPRQRVRNIRNLIVSPTREHSRKAAQMRSDIEALWPGPYAELFAREAAPGWDAWGNQAEKFNA
jgi:N6-adenosine-specific RNA methylase IME4